MSKRNDILTESSNPDLEKRILAKVEPFLEQRRSQLNDRKSLKFSNLFWWALGSSGLATAALMVVLLQPKETEAPPQTAHIEREMLENLEVLRNLEFYREYETIKALRKSKEWKTKKS
jgi:hypothetical protein